MNTRQQNETLAAEINHAYAKGATVLFNGQQVKSHSLSGPANIYGNGTLSVTVQARTTAGLNALYVKVGSAKVPSVEVR